MKGEEGINAIASSAAAEGVMHIKVPVREQTSEKSSVRAIHPADVQQGGHEEEKVKCIRRVDCVEGGP